MSTIHAFQFGSDSCGIDFLEEAMSASDYWEPDSKSCWYSDDHRVGLAKAQLFNTERSKNDVVHCDHIAGLVITANARIDNRDELQQMLGLCDDSNVQTDGELILQCYKSWGRDCPAMLRGDFVFVIWDSTLEKLFCARDHFGVKTLFYCRTEGGVQLANEHNAFFVSGWCDPNSINETWLIRNLWGLERSIFESPHPDIHLLPPAHILEIDANGLMISKYWELGTITDWEDLSDEELLYEFKNKFSKSVERRLESNYGVGAELSEGLDSNGVAGFAAKLMGDRALYALSYQCEALNEETIPIWGAVYSDITAMIDMHENIVPIYSSCPESFEQEKSFLKREYYKNFGGVVSSHGFHLRRAFVAGQHDVRVLLSGWGGDHCVTSYGDEYANEVFRSGHLIELYTLLKRMCKRGRGTKPMIAMLRIAIDEIKYLIGMENVNSPSKRGRIKKHFLKQNLVTKYIKNSDKNSVLRFKKTVKNKENLELFGRGLVNRLTESELVARQHRVEYRYPMLDVDLVEFAHNLPSRLKIYNGIERYAFRAILDDVTTERNQWRRKSDVPRTKLTTVAYMRNRITQLQNDLNNSHLVNLFSAPESVLNSLKTNDPILLNCLEFLVSVENYYFGSNQDNATISS